MLKCQEICQEILQFLAGNIAINKDENRKSSFMKVEALVKSVNCSIIQLNRQFENPWRGIDSAVFNRYIFL
jgi:hypothetical protein